MVAVEKAYRSFCIDLLLAFCEEFEKEFGMKLPLEEPMIKSKDRLLKFCFTHPGEVTEETPYRMNNVAERAGLYEHAGNPEGVNTVQIRNRRPNEDDFVITVGHFDSVDEIVRKNYFKSKEKP
jgi:hypothetical protein